MLFRSTTQSTASNRIRIYVNGLEVTAFSTSADPSLNLDSGVNSATLHTIASQSRGTSYYFNGLLADIHFIDGQALTPSSFGEFDATTGVWNPKAYSGPTPTGNSFWLPFSDNSAATATTLGKDGFLLGNNWTPNNLSATAAPTIPWVYRTSNVGGMAGFASIANVFDRSLTTYAQLDTNGIGWAGFSLSTAITGTVIRLYVWSNCGAIRINGTTTYSASGVWSWISINETSVTQIEGPACGGGGS